MADQLPDHPADPDHVEDPDPEARAAHLERTTTRTTRAPIPATSIARGRALVAAADPHTRRANQINQRTAFTRYFINFFAADRQYST